MANLSQEISSDDVKSKTRFPFLVLAVSIILTIGITYSFYQSAVSKDTTRFNNEVSRIKSAIDNKINLYTALLKGGRGFVESAAKLNKQSFEKYVQSLDLEKNYKSVQAIGYSKTVTSKQREELFKQMQAEGMPEFDIFPGGERENYQAVIYIEPFNEQNKKEIGYDMFTETGRREALLRAESSGAPAASAKVNLLHSGTENTQAGFLIYLPIYEKGIVPETAGEKTKNLIGYIYSPLRSDDFLNEIQKSTDTSDIAVKIYDGEPQLENLLTQTNLVVNPVLSDQIEQALSTESEMLIGGRKWTIKYNSLPAFAEQSSVNWMPLIFFSGIIVSFLLFGMTYWETSARLSLQATANRLTQSEAQKQKLLENEQYARLLAEQANVTKDEFIAVVSHELRTPLNAIAGWIKILKTGNLSANTKTLALEKINKNLRSQTQLVEDLLEYSQLLSGQINFEEKPINVSELFDEISGDIEPIAQEKNIEYLKSNKLNGNLILGDETKLKIVVYNLLTNAVKFTHAGGKIEAQLFASDDGAIHITIRDNGKGIAPEFLPHIFDRFSQADSSTTRSFGGLGLGLTISKHIVKIHRGTIEAASEGIGTGTEFTIKFPILHKVK